MTQTITVTGTDLFHLAAQYLGDATQWIRIAQQNGLSDPVITGAPVQIVIPDVDTAATGGAPTQ
jgi:L-ascorbate metabolism protein UlaG (beta-lactamase superfamily)